jgi:cytolysin (calcineurin-like family phosphatase)
MCQQQRKKAMITISLSSVCIFGFLAAIGTLRHNRGMFWTAAFAATVLGTVFLRAVS